MPNFISESAIAFHKLEEIYRDAVYGKLETPFKELHLIFQKLLDQYAEDYSLTKTNSVYKTKYYYINGRIKSHINFKEKLVRKDIGVKLINDLDLLNKNGDVFADKRAEIIAGLQILDDIIGLRIVAELQNDCLNVLRLLQDKVNDLQQEGIEFSDIRNQPQVMKNGLDILRIKGIFQKQFGFELQIKSKINETWGDIDHALFYKEYGITPIRDTVQITMNNVGFLLEKIEKLLYDLREAGDVYSGSAAQIQAHQMLEDELAPLLRQAYGGVAYDIKDLSDYLSFFKAKLQVGSLRLNELNFDYLNLTLTDPLLVRYASIRQKSMKLNTLEGCYMNWVGLTGVPLNQANIEEVTSDYLARLKLRLIENILVEGFDFNNYFELLIPYSEDPNLFLSIEKHEKAIEVYNRVVEILSANDRSEEQKKSIGQLFLINFFNGDFETFIENLDEELEWQSNLLLIKDEVKKSGIDVDKKINAMVINILDKFSN